jgi:hypothetical protein
MGVGEQLHVPATLLSGKIPGTHSREDGVSPRARHDGYREEKNSSNPGPSSP